MNAHRATTEASMQRFLWSFLCQVFPSQTTTDLLVLGPRLRTATKILSTMRPRTGRCHGKHVQQAEKKPFAWLDAGPISF